MSGIKNLKVITAGLCFGAMILSGCNNKVVVGNSKIVYDSENDEIAGNITFEDLNKYGKVVVLEDNGENLSKLLLKKVGSVSGHSSRLYDSIDYIDLETGAMLISYRDYAAGYKEWKTGENLNIISEVGITNYLANGEFVKSIYRIDELINFFKNNVVSTLDTNEKELVK